jgi:putative alpha-1,2-mannosidase
MEDVAARLGVEALSEDEVKELLEREGVSSVEEIPADAEVLVGEWDEVLGRLEGGEREKRER